LETTSFNYSFRHVNHRIATGGIVACAGLAILIFVGGSSKPFQLLLALGIVVVVFYAARFHRLKSGDGVAVRVGRDGLQVAEWGTGLVPWSEIQSIEIVGRTTIVITPRDAALWFSRLNLMDRARLRVASLAGSDPFTIDAGLLSGQPVELETTMQQWLAVSRS
jgi:hypothetical protein